MKPSGNIKSTHDFEPFGVELEPIGDDTTNFNYKYTGQERDTFTNYDYMHFRFYASSIGRFLTLDNIIPDITNPQNWNGYSYVKGNPINFNDPLGHFTNVPHGTKAILYRPGGELMPTAFEYGGDWISIEIFEFFGVKPIYITLNVVIDETMSEEEKIEAKAEFEDQLTKANSVYNKIAIYLSAEVSEGVVPRFDSGIKEFIRQSRTLGKPKMINVFLSNSYSKANSAVDIKNKNGFAWIPIANRNISEWHLAHELGHIFGIRFGNPLWTDAVNDAVIDSLILYLRGGPLWYMPIYWPIPTTIIVTSLWLRYNASSWCVP